MCVYRGLGLQQLFKYTSGAQHHICTSYVRFTLCIYVCCYRLYLLLLLLEKKKWEKSASEKNELNLHRKLVKKLRQSCAAANTDETLYTHTHTYMRTHTNWRISYMLFILTHAYTNNYMYTFHNYIQQQQRQRGQRQGHSGRKGRH